MKISEDDSIYLFSPYTYRVDRSVSGDVYTTLGSDIGMPSKYPVFHDALHTRINLLSTYTTQLFQKNIFVFWFLICIFCAGVIATFFILHFNISVTYPNKKSLAEKLYTPFPLSLVQRESDLLSDDKESLIVNQATFETYTLQTGDYLLSLSDTFNRTVDTLVSWNNITDARRIRAGDEIIVPNQNGILYTIAEGDTIDSISEKYNVSVANILDANNLESNVIKKNDRLFLPEAKMDEFELGLILGTAFQSPMRGYISSGYGYRISPITGIRSFHGAIDIVSGTGASVYAAMHGVVSYVAENNPVYGKLVIIKHEGGFQTLYAHLDDIYVRKGQYVSRGRAIGIVGNTGLSTGEHLHFAIILNGNAVNPLRYISLRR